MTHNSPTSTSCKTRRSFRHSAATALATWAILAASALLCIGATEKPKTTGDFISVAQQLRLKRQIMMGKASLLATLQDNRRKWESASESERRQLREKAMAFRQADSADQQKIIDALERFNTLSDAQQQSYRQRAQWIQQIENSLTKAQRETLHQLPPKQRAAELLRLSKAM